VIPAIVAAGLVAVVLVGRALLVVVTVVGISMEPTYHHGDRVLVLRARWLAARRGAVVVFASPRPSREPPTGPPPGFPGPGPGFPGLPPARPAPATADRTAPARDWLIKRVVARPGDGTPEAVPAPRVARVPDGHLVVYGDNGGVDSRTFGYLPLDRVRGVVIADLGRAP
jgi:signal peptidase I